MKLPSARIRKRGAPQRQQSDSHQTISVPRRRSSRLQSRQRSVSILHGLETYYKPQSLFEQRPTDPKTSPPAGVISHTRLPTSDPIEASAPKPSREQFQGPRLPQTHTHQTQKRRRDESVETSIETPPKRARLTKKNLKLFEKMRRPSKTSAGDRPESKKRSEPQSSRSESKSLLSDGSKSSSKTVSTTDSNFPPLAYANGILQEPNAKPPTNLKFLQDRANRSRDTASPTESEYKIAAHKLLVAENEGTIAEETSKLLKDYRVTDYRRATNLPFKDFPKNVGFNNGLSAAQPDLVEGLEMPEFDPFPVSEQFGGAAIPYLSTNAITLPHIAGEWKGPGKDMNLARLQQAYDGASMVYGRNTARSFLEAPDPIDSSHVVGFTSDGTSVKTFANYSSDIQGHLKYHQYPITSTFITSSYEDFKKGRRQLRNLQDYAKETSEKLRDELNKKWSANQHQPPASTSLPAETVDVRDDGCHYDDQEDGEDDPSCQLLIEYHASFNDQGGYNPPAAPQPLTSGCEHNPNNGPEVLTADDGYNPDSSNVYNTNTGYYPSDTSTYSPITPPYSSGNVPLPLESQTQSGWSRRRTRNGRNVLKK